MTASELKYHVEQEGHSPHFFTRSTMRFHGDTMRNFGVRRAECAGTAAWELYTKRPTKHGRLASYYFDATTFERLHPTKGEGQ
jgi:hypothetical protein